MRGKTTENGTRGRKDKCDTRGERDTRVKSQMRYEGGDDRERDTRAERQTRHEEETTENGTEKRDMRQITGQRRGGRDDPKEENVCVCVCCFLFFFHTYTLHHLLERIG